MTTNPHLYTCEFCHGTFVTSVTDQEAIEEYHREYPEESKQDHELITVCNECYLKLTADERKAN